eukprot:scaffold122119_cov60-Phaeocystis_antarctica.AAC.1
MDVHRAAEGQRRSKRWAHQALRFVVEMYKTAATRGSTVRRSGAIRRSGSGAASARVRGVSVCARGRTVVATDEGVAILGLELPIYVLLRLFHRNVHEAVEAREHACAAAWQAQRAPRGAGHGGTPPR